MKPAGALALAKRPIGRPTIYRPDLGQIIADAMAADLSPPPSNAGWGRDFMLSDPRDPPKKEWRHS